jgi:hypothetical protein
MARMSSDEQERSRCLGAGGKQDSKIHHEGTKKKGATKSTKLKVRQGHNSPEAGV